MAYPVGAVVAALGNACSAAVGREMEAEGPSAVARADAGCVDFGEVALGYARSVRTVSAVQSLKDPTGRCSLVARLVADLPEVGRLVLPQEVLAPMVPQY